MNFRKDINGLRAFAVIAVVLFHFQIAGFSGGFVGVDIFFVISGYLMTGIIFSKFSNNNFSIINFYLHRARRIIPALAFLCIFMLLFSISYLTYEEIKDVIDWLRSSIKFTSNLEYYNETDYFARPAQYNWLLHTWSLSVEWQFYLIYPLVILVLRKLFPEKVCKSFLLIVLFFSLGLSIFYTPLNSSAAFFLLPTRAWEMLAGGMIFLYPLSLNNSIKSFCYYSGIVLILLSVIFLSESILWPSYYALFPVMGAMLVLFANRSHLLTDNFICQFIGKISYSVYLWHWPVVVLLRSCAFLTELIYIVLGIVTSFILGIVSYYLIESRFKLKRSYLFEIIKYLLIIIIIDQSALEIKRFLKKHPEYQYKIPNDYVSTKYLEFYNQCVFTDSYDNFDLSKECSYGSKPPSIIIFGDSVSVSVFSAIEKLNKNSGTILWEHNGCPTVEEFQFNAKRNNQCVSFIKDKMNKLNHQYKNVPLLIVNRYSIYTNAKEGDLYYMYFENNPTDRKEYLNTYQKNYIKTICKLTKNRPVYILKPIPEMSFDPKIVWIMRMNFFTKPAGVDIPVEQHKQNYQFINSMIDKASQECGSISIDPSDILCSNGKCISTENDVLLYEDQGHLNEDGAKYLTPLFEKMIKEI